MAELPAHLQRYPTRAGRVSLAARLGLTIDPFSQDWEWEVAEPEHFPEWLAVYRKEPLSDDEQFSLMMMLVQCVEDRARDRGPANPVEEMPEWHALAALLKANPRLHAATVAYWSVLGEGDLDGQFAVSSAMRTVWADINRTERSDN